MCWSHVKAFSFFFCTTSDAKSTKDRTIYYRQNDCETTSKESINSSCVFTCSGKVQKCGEQKLNR